MPRPENNSRLGRTRNLTDTPEKNQIEEEYRKKEEKEKRKEERSKNKRGPKRVLHPPEKSSTEKKTKRATKENCAPRDCVDEDPNDESNRNVDVMGGDLEQHLPDTPPRCTRAGRIIRQKKITNV